jgi:hypothetical protein
MNKHYEGPYRTMNLITGKRLPRFRARLRTLFWRVLMPTKVISVIFGIGLMCVLSLKVHLEIERLNQEAHLEDWERALDGRQAKLDEDEKQDVIKTGNLDMQLREVDLARRLQLPVRVRGTYEEFPSDFHDIAVVHGEEKPILCYMDRAGMDVTLKCVAIHPSASIHN